MDLTAAIIVPTRDRAGYLARTLASIVPQAAAAGGEGEARPRGKGEERHAAPAPDEGAERPSEAGRRDGEKGSRVPIEVIVVDDGPDEETRAVTEAHGARYVPHERTLGLNAARNTGIAATGAEWLIYVDDDVEVRPGWLDALLRAAAEAPDDVGVLAGAIHGRIENPRYRQCGREGPPITFLERDEGVAWGSNMTVRRSWIERVGIFDPALIGPQRRNAQRDLYGDEQEWQERVRAAGGRVLWVPDAALDHRRAGEDATVRALASAAYRRGQANRRFDELKGTAPGRGAERALLLRTALHGPRFLCSNGPVMAADAFGRLRAVGTGGEDFLSGASGTVGGKRGVVRAAADRVLDVVTPGAGAGWTGTAVVLAIVRPENAAVWERARRELEGPGVEIRTSAPRGGKFETLNSMLGAPVDADWLVVVDDDVELPTDFLRRFLGAAEDAGLELAQPAHRLHSHAAWDVTRRRPFSRFRQTTFVEIGPVTAFGRTAQHELLPFPDLKMGWGLDNHWAGVARERGWRIGVVDATPILHLNPAGDAYRRDDAIAEARAFLAGRPYVPRDEVRTVRR